MGRIVAMIGAVIFVPLISAGIVLYFGDDMVDPPQTIELRNVELENDVGAIAFDEWQVRQQEELAAIIEAKEAEKVTLFVAGDVMLARTVETKMLEKGDFNYCFLPMREIISSADIAMANLETPIIEGQPTPIDSVVFRADPRAVKGLAGAGFDIVTVANNHFGDQGQEGMKSTFIHLGKNNLDYTGGGLDKAHISNPIVKKVKGMNIAFLGYAYGPDYYAATADKAGVALMDTEQMIKDLTLAKSNSDFVVVNMHAGTEYVDEPSQQQIDFAHAAIDNGADLIIGHHPHWVQSMEIYKEKYIFYSLGNFVFDQAWSIETRQGLAISFTIDSSGVVDLDYHPIKIEDYCQPNLASGVDRATIMDKL